MQPLRWLLIIRTTNSLIVAFETRRKTMPWLVFTRNGSPKVAWQLDLMKSHPSLAWRYCAVQQRIQIGLRESAALRHTLSMVSWNAGAARQRLDVGLFCSKSFVCGAIQEANDEVYQQLLRHGCRVFRPNNEDITAWVFIGDQFLEGGEVIHEHLRNRRSRALDSYCHFCPFEVKGTSRLGGPRGHLRKCSFEQCCC